MVSPLEFIANLEETGRIVRIGQWVLEQACRQLGDWHDQLDNTLSVGVNISKRQVGDPAFVPGVQRILEATGIPRHCLHLEITERVIMENPDSITDVLNQLK